MLEFIQNFLTFPFWVVSTFFVYGFGIIVYIGLFEICRYYKPWEPIIDWWRVKRK